MRKKKLYGETTKEQLIASAKDRVYNFTLADSTVRGAFINGTRMVNEMRANFELGILETLVAGHAYLACGLLSATLKGNDRLSLHIDCTGPVKGISVEVNSFGEVRGYLKNVPIPIEKPLDNFNLSPFFGGGFLTITKYLENLKQPYTGQVALEYGSIAEDLAHYFLSSEQTPTVFSLSIQFDSEGKAIGAGGLFLQAMPGANLEITEGLEGIIKKMDSPARLIIENTPPEEIINSAFIEYNPKILNNYRVEFFCRCNERVIANYINMLPIDDLVDISQNGPFPLETKCHNCNTTYSFSEDDIKKMLDTRMH